MTSVNFCTLVEITICKKKKVFHSYLRKLIIYKELEF